MTGKATSNGNGEEPAAVWVDIEQLKPWVKNPRLNDDAVEPVAESVKRFGFAAPIIARRANGEIIAGHTRLKAAIKLGLKKVPVRYVDLEPSDAHLLAVADNRLGEIAQWDPGPLSEVLSGYDDADKALAGFTAKDLDELVAGIDGGQEVEEDEVPEPPKVPITKVGDVWTLGEHRITCGDSAQPSTYSRLMNSEELRLIVTDPPYGVAYADKNTWLNELDEGNRVQTPIENDHGDIKDIAEKVWRPVFQCLHDVASPGCALYAFAPQGGDQMMMMMMMQASFPVRHELIWVKNNHVLGRADYAYKHEPILYAWKKGGHKYYGGFQTSLLEFARPQKSDLHPTMKPVALVAKLIENSSRDGEVVGDAFLGSGTTLVAAEQLNRRCFGIEISPAYCDVIVERWQNLTGQTATRSG